MGAQEISSVRLVSTRSMKVSTLRLVTSEDVERARKELVARQATSTFAGKGAATEGMRLQHAPRQVPVASRFLDLTIRVAGFVFATMVFFVIGVALVNYSEVESGGRVVVQTGDTLWSVAMSVPEVPSITAAIEDIKELNGLQSDTLSVGQDLIIPRY